ncbi:unnamed protein product [Didymodactylos carnosus]|uniref:non-specific serine/threonine protein kinase n=1 Tax=Didymodactylos carnosus TaxID=1234261 RepID=A0A8S2XVX9_9BILA|nr:unnamed protein product [Didymodactylos carnosus]CAF4515868.1 unnamed protein product [Didymodactylos carnosus]
MLGKGSQGEVWLVVSVQGGSKQFVMKRFLLNISHDTYATGGEPQKEAKLLSKLQHPNIVQYIDSFQCERYLNIVMTYCAGGDLYTKIKQQKLKKQLFSEDQIVDWFVQICTAIQVI